MPLIESDMVKRALIRINRLHDTLDRLNLIVIEKQDLIKWRGPGYRQQILYGQPGHDRVKELLARREPLMISRIGAVELTCLRHYLEKRRTRQTPYPRKIRTTMSNQAGFFPADDASLDAFAEMFLGHIASVDVMGVWFNQYENVVCNDHCPRAALVDLDCLEPFRFAHPWSSLLAGKTVLVVHPFEDSIRSQYREKRELLFADPEVLPEFELKTIKAVQSIGGASTGFATWFDAYRSMCDAIAAETFDICIVGAGAYGLPLASFVKQMGRPAVHLGGVTQVLFGIKGKRWEREYADSTMKLFNEHWVRPSAGETPVNKEKIERGCYW
ncbi:hypothetical protein [Geomesophilobacter sediminis]|uniref:Uncharacterized protein n=1 Tax=Geomesophilobacter sediminis TaxID=2798584 RepID=A0A8J7SA81_9BACT|nr:hypothetical protein [Geomesophilobacter sediminis]MBJ6727315.1 hypothetical protein [Geomesophilobacter sediminis]